MSYLNDIYFKRLNRYGSDYKTRTQNLRKKEFEDLLSKSAYRIDFSYNNVSNPGILNRYKQDETQTLQYLLTRENLIIPNGTILTLTDRHNVGKPWMVFWLEESPMGGYNTYIMLKMSHQITWKARDGSSNTIWAYFHGQGNRFIRDIVESNKGEAVYREDSNSAGFVCSFNEKIRKDDYFEIMVDNLKQSYVVSGYDNISNPGVEYVSVDPVYNRNTTTNNTSSESINSYWLQGVSNGNT